MASSFVRAASRRYRTPAHILFGFLPRRSRTKSAAASIDLRESVSRFPGNRTQISGSMAKSFTKIPSELLFADQHAQFERGAPIAQPLKLMPSESPGDSSNPPGSNEADLAGYLSDCRFASALARVWLVMTAKDYLEKRLRTHVLRLARDIGERNLFRLSTLEAAGSYLEREWREQGYAVERLAYEVSVSVAQTSKSRVGASRAKARFCWLALTTIR